MPTTSKRALHLDVLRIIAIFFVIFNHLSGYTLYMSTSGINQFFYMFLTMITRLNVPVFFMISGALLLSKEETVTTVIKKRVSRFFIVLVIFSFGLYLLSFIKNFIFGNDVTFHILNFLNELISGSITVAFSYWFLYAYLGFLLLLPLMQRVAKGMTKHEFYLLIIAHFVFSSLVPIINGIFTVFELETISISSNFAMHLATQKYLFYPLIGYFIDSKIEISKFKTKHIALLWLVAILGILCSCACTKYQGTFTGTYAQTYVQLFDYVTAIATFLTVKYAIAVRPIPLNEKVSHRIAKISSLTFGIYLIDPYFKLVFYDTFETLFESFLPVLVVSLGWCALSMFLGGLITLLLKKNRLLEKIL